MMISHWESRNAHRREYVSPPHFTWNGGGSSEKQINIAEGCFSKVFQYSNMLDVQKRLCLGIERVPRASELLMGEMMTQAEM